MTDDWPSFAEELDRKTLAVLRKYIAAHEAGKIDTRTMLLVVNALYDSASGLIPKATSDLIADIHKDLRRALAART